MALRRQQCGHPRNKEWNRRITERREHFREQGCPKSEIFSVAALDVFRIALVFLGDARQHRFNEALRSGGRSALENSGGGLESSPSQRVL